MPVPSLAGKENLAGFRKEICPARRNKPAAWKKAPLKAGPVDREGKRQSLRREPRNLKVRFAALR